MTARRASTASRRMGFLSRHTSRPGTRLLLGFLTAFYPLLMCQADAGNLPGAQELIARMVERATMVASAQEWPEYTCQSRTTIEQRKSSGKVIASEEKTHDVRWVGGYPLRQLTRINGRTLTAEERAEEEAEEERLRRRFTSVSMEELAARRETWVTTNLLARYEFELVDRITVSNRATLRMTFRPRQGKLPSDTLQDELLNLMAGTIWIDEQDADAVKMSVELQDTLPLGWFGLLGSLSRCEWTLERTRLPEGVWANARQTFVIQLRMLATTKRYHVTEVSSGYRRVPPQPLPGPIR